MQYPTDPTLLSQASREAVARAHQDNQKALEKRIGRMSETNLIEFVRKNFEELHDDPCMKGRNLALIFDIAIGYEEGNKSENIASLRKLVTTFVYQTKQNLLPFMKQFKGLKFRTPEDAQKQIDKEAADIVASNAELLKAVRSVGSGIKNTLYTGVSALALPLTFSHYMLVKPTAHIWSAICKRFNITKVQSAIILATMLTLAGGPTVYELTKEIDATPYKHLYVSGELSQRIFKEACHYDGVQNGSMMTLSYALASMPTNVSEDKYETKMLHFMSAMAGAGEGVEPVVLDLLSRMETGNFFSTWAKGTSAKGAYQTIDETAIRTIAIFGTKIQAYKEAAGKKDALSRELHLSLTRLSKDWNTDNGATVLSRFRRGVVPLAYTSAINFARQPIVSGQIAAREVLRVAPELSIQNLRGKSIEYIVEVLSQKVYPGYWAGEEGANFLDYVGSKAPNTYMDDTEALKKLYTQYNPSADAKTAEKMGGYFAMILPGNPAIMRYSPNKATPAHVKPAQYKQMITNAMLEVIGTPASAISAVLAQNPTAFDACVTNKEQLLAEAEAIKQQVPLKTTMADVYWRTHVPLEQRELAAAFYARAMDIVWPKKADENEAPQPKWVQGYKLN